ncbi:hypothetical protein SD457_17310 [Coprobacillaceae bacterium CR2/5/TPMF4]|nr:hypothetical protein SD457_17310 [Coprobacillaceae bacterium CR2/5/TPMF4]
MLEKYEIKSFYTEEGKINMTPNVVEFTDIFRQRGLILNDQFQMIDGWAIYPRTYFTPIDPHGNRNKTKIHILIIILLLHGKLKKSKI